MITSFMFATVGAILLASWPNFLFALNTDEVHIV